MSENNQDITMDNQQGKMHFNIGWLVGMIEGEGCITLAAGARTNSKYGHKISPYLSITSTDKRLIDKAIEIIDFFHLPVHLDKREYHNGKKWKDRYTLQVFGQKRVKEWLILIKPYLVGKQEQAEIVLSFIEQRQKILNKHPWHKPYTNEDLVLYEKVHKLNGRLGRSAKPSETKRRPGKPPVKV